MRVSLFLVALSLFLVCTHATQRRSRHRYDDEDAVLPPPAPLGFLPGFMPGAAGLVPPLAALTSPSPSEDAASSATSASTGAGDDGGAKVSSSSLLEDLLPRFMSLRGEGGESSTNADLIKSIYTLLAKKRDMNVEETSKVMQEKVATRKKDEDLTRKQEELKKRAEMLTRLQYCLEQDASGNIDPKKKGGAEGGDSSSSKGSSNSTGSLSKSEAEQRLRELKKAQADLEKKEALLQARERELKREQELMKKRVELVQKREAAVSKAENDDAISGGKGGKGSSSDSDKELVCPGTCAANRECGSCVDDSRCGWCSSSQKCFDASEGRPANCSSPDWSVNYCKSQECTEHSSCRACMADPQCGRCATTGKCVKGTLTGPDQGSCPAWNFAAPFRFLSFNIYGRDTSNTTGRAPVIFKILREANADFVALQEVEDWFLEALAKEKWARNYHASDFGSGHAPGGLLIMSKIPLASVAYYEKTQPGQVEVDQRARMLAVRPKLGEENLVIATTTLDWRSGENRADSLDYMFSVLNSTEDAVLMGDFNFDYAAQPETSHIPATWKDVWSELRPKQPGFTWDPINNSYARKSDPKSRPSRIDRIFVRSPAARMSKIEKIGCDEAGPHYGALSDVQLYNAFC